MTLEFDGFEAWRAVAKHPDTFSSLRAEATKSSRTALIKHVKSRNVGLAQMQEVRQALGRELFALLVDSMKDSDLKSLVARLDKHNAEVKTAEADRRRTHFIALVEGEVAPAPKAARVKPEKSSRKSTARKSGTAETGFVSAGAVRKR